MQYIGTDDRFYDAAKTISRGSGQYTDDLYIHCIEELMKQHLNKLNSLYNQGKLIAFFIRILQNQLHSNTSSFYRLYRHNQHRSNSNYDDYSDHFENTLTTTIDDEPVPTESEFIWNEINETLDELYWYKKSLFELYKDLGTYERVNEVTGIPYFSISQTIREVKDFLRTEVDYDGLKQEYNKKFGNDDTN